MRTTVDRRSSPQQPMGKRQLIAVLLVSLVAATITIPAASATTAAPTTTTTTAAPTTAVPGAPGAPTTIDPDTPFTSRGKAYGIVGAALGAVLIAAVLLVRVAAVQLSPTQLLLVKCFCALLLWACVAIVVVLAKDDYAVAQSPPLYLSFGEATAFLLALVLIPTTKHAGLGVLIGSSYDRMLFLHPLLGVTVLVAMTVHMGGMFTSFPDPSDLFEDPSNVCAFLSWVSMVCVVLPAMFLRRKSYNLFRATHCLFVLVLVFGVLHVGQLAAMLAPSVVLWVVDIVLRVVSATSSKARVVDLSYNANAEMVTLRLSVMWPSAPRPGSYAFLLVRSISPVSHPFTVSLCEEADKQDTSRRVVTFFIKSNGGSTFTAKLADCVKLGVESPSVSLLGPHGNLQVPVVECQHVVLVCGGIGVTPMLAILEFVAHNILLLPALQGVTLVWAARDAALFEMFKSTVDGLAALCSPKVHVSVMLFHTGDVGTRRLLVPPTGIELSVFGDEEHRPIGDGGVRVTPPRDPRITPGRPDFQKAFRTIRSERVGCYVCGPLSLVDSATEEAARRQFMIHVESFEF